MSSKTVRTIVISVALAVAAVAYGAYRYSEEHGRPEFTFDTAAVTRGPIVARVTASGTLSALVTVQVGSQVSGRVQQIFVDYNSRVAKGEVIATIDPQLFEAAEAQAKANYVAAQDNLAKARAAALDADRQYERANNLFADKLVAQADLDTAQATYDEAKAEVGAAEGSVEQTRAALHQAEVNLAYTTIRSPIDGVVISRNVDVGQTVAASLQAPTLFVIAENLHKMQVDTSVAEADVGRLRSGMKASFTVDAFPNETFTGVVRQIRNAPQVVQNVVTYDAVIDIGNPDLKLKPGMTANVTFVYAQADDVLRIPNAALRFRPTPQLLAWIGGGRPSTPASSAAGGPPAREAEEANRRTIWALHAGVPAPTTIETGITDGTVTQVVAGDLRVGERVVIDILSGPGSGAGGSNRFRRMF
jgi:HlyD family secretion protein